ncbi:glutaminase [Georgenia wangjunii]|uniref:glutaminase n=1 Tax=Georgenia wangjunii TaxID=3117730 RepID=UPI002F267C15
MKTPVPDYLDEVLDSLRDDTSGANAHYIPELAAADPDRFGMALTTTLGRTYAAGDADTEFSIQSISKPFNAGAISAHSLLVGAEASQDDRVDRAVTFFSHLAGRDLQVDERVCASELDAAHRNLAIAYMLRTYGILDGDVPSVVEGYTRQCSVLVSARDLSVMAATLATGGIQPVTGERLMEPAVAQHVMAVMAAAGMYDAAGDWLTRVGIPAKSGVAGGIVGVLPDRVGIGTFSPRLDSHGNSHRGRLAFERLSQDMGMHLFASDRGRLDAVDVSESGGTLTFALQGNIQLTAASELLDLMADAAGAADVVLDVTRVHSFSDLGRRMALEGLRRLRLDGRKVAVRDPLGVLPHPDLGDGTYPDVV